METRNITFKGYIDRRSKPINLKPEDEWLFSKEYVKQIPDTTVITIKSAAILNEIIFDRNRFRFLYSYSRLKPIGYKECLRDVALLRKKPVHVDSGIWIIDEWSYNYFHFMTDALSRLAGSGILSGKYPVLLPQRYKNLDYVKESIRRMGFEIYFFAPGINLKVGRLVLPSHTAISGDYHKDIVPILRERILSDIQIQPAPWRKVYISRKKANKRQVENKDDVEALVLQYGFEIHYFEDYDWKKQLKIMSETKCLISMHGAGLTNMLFMPFGGCVLEFRRKGDDEFNCYFSLASAMKHRYFYQLSEVPGDSALIDIAELKKNVEEMSCELKSWDF